MPDAAEAEVPERPSILSGYTPLPGVPDELLADDGSIRPEWAGLIAHLDAMKPDERERAFARGTQYLRDAGVFVRNYGEDKSRRDWPWSPLPVIQPARQWQALAEGLAERADLLEAVVADLYGANRLVAEGHLPADVIASNPEWLRPLVGVKPASGHFLHFLSFEIGRGPDGGWWVLGDRTQAPSGAGYALENRVASARSYAGFLNSSNVERLAGFFRAFRDGLNALRHEDGSRAGILTPGPMNETYFEHAYIARYLGMMLLEGDDLTVDDGRLMVRTVSGPKPISVLWRRLDAAWADPLELEGSSRLGTPGLLGAVRAEGVTMINALGAGILESRAFLAFLPRLSEVLHGRKLSVPNIATWWCGGAEERAHVRAHADAMLIGSANSTRLPLEAEPGVVLRGDTSAIGTDLDTWLSEEGRNLVGQELVSLSTTPCWEDGGLQPKPVRIRVFMARTREGWQLMHGGLARLAATGQDPSAVSISSGGTVADVWVVSDTPVPEDSMLMQTGESFVRTSPGLLPSRAADNLFWLGRYVERAEGQMRLTRAYMSRLDETPLGGTPLMTALEAYLEEHALAISEGVPSEIARTISFAVNAANRVRDRFSVDAWASLADLETTIAKMGHTVRPGDDAASAMGVLLRKITGFSGLVHENMYRFSGWRFLTIGRSLERALAMADLLATFGEWQSPHGGFELCVELGDSVMTHRRRYPVTASRDTVVDLLALDPLNPRSIAFHVDEIRDQVSLLPGADLNGQLSALSRSVLRVQSDLAVLTPQSLDQAKLVDLAQAIGLLTNDIHAQFLD
ncbi:circularly permuted type 2 ATP-grasp protein [Hoeflea ulvae]|uniref:Circularly permuted type 2 ATP-grasp protein n=1 Tax=Hoeflea ulvae TaxID=2983764 RepID=A0ABT3YDK7_9HYPH|nr:circularly permuted type 2 ATP-grasp protein [Hoeflea ulvae]MCY0093980.1 circularly permuted type 2 ATP-grasp protein [Hoeflea ulvae]